ncbi:hypothetical protein ACF05L_19735 [Streptomyces bobili]
MLPAGARRRELPEDETEDVLPTAERCLFWLRDTVGEGGYLC